MALSLNKRIIAFILFVLITGVYSAQVNERTQDKEYKDPEQFDEFFKRRKIISAWQINEFKQGALVVRLKANKFVIDALIKAGNTEMAEKKRLEALAINLNITKAYRSNYSFNKVYFIYSNYSDSLLNGVRSNIFLDTNLTIDPKIVMTEKFYLLAEYDDIYNSSIGFVPEDSARYISEKGNVSTPEAPIVVKNKYGHQLKQPFPYKYYFLPGRRLVLKKIYEEEMVIDGKKTTFTVTRSKSNNTTMRLVIPEDLTYSRISVLVKDLNDNLEYYYRFNPKPDAEKLQNVKPFLY